jgi:O-antigen/teichoic acid export membrane protein
VSKESIAVLRGFVFGEMLSQVLNAITGLLLVRWLTVEQFAQYSLTNAFQTTAQQFVEFGLGGSLVALVGQQISDKRRMGRLIAAGTNIRRRMLLVVGAICVFAFPYWFVQKGWPLGSGLLLTVAVLGYLVASGLVTYYSPPLTIHRQMPVIYRIKLLSDAARLACLAAAHAANVLFVPVAALLNVVVLWMNGIQLKRAAAPYHEAPVGHVLEEEGEIRRFIRPIMPGVVFAAMQGQLALFLAAWFGQTTTIAEVGALSRLGIILGFFGAANSMLIAPYIARQPAKNLLAHYMPVIAGALTISLALYFAAWVLPDLFLRVLGPNYSGSHGALLAMVSATAINYLNSVFWTLNAARKWVYWWMPVISIPGTLVVQAFGLWVFDVSTAVGVFQVMLVTAVFTLFTRCLVTVRGFVVESRVER